MQKEESFAPKRRMIWTLVVSACIAVLGAISFDVYRRATAMRTTNTTAANVLAAKSGERVQAVVRIEASDGQKTYSVELLQVDAGGEYRETSSRLRVRLAADVSIGMGDTADMKPGAVVQVSGVVDGTHTFDIHKVVILSGYVKVKSGPG
jgi:hypothetical protein